MLAVLIRSRVTPWDPSQALGPNTLDSHLPPAWSPRPHRGSQEASSPFLHPETSTMSTMRKALCWGSPIVHTFLKSVCYFITIVSGSCLLPTFADLTLLYTALQPLVPVSLHVLGWGDRGSAILRLRMQVVVPILLQCNSPVCPWQKPGSAWGAAANSTK